MFGLGPTELIVILILALVVLGPQRIPEVASSLGKAIRGFRKATRELRDQIDIEDEVRRPFEDLHAALRDEPRRNPPPVLPQLVTAPGDPNFVRMPTDQNFVPIAHHHVPTALHEGPNPAEVIHVETGHHDLEAASAPTGEVTPALSVPAPQVAASPAVASLAAPPAEPVVSADSAADHFRRAAQADSVTKGAS